MPIKKKCEECRKIFRKLYGHKHRYFCWKCYKKKVKMLWGIAPRRGRTLDQVLDKTHIVRGYLHKHTSGATYLHCSVNLPAIMAGRKIKISLVKGGDCNGKLNRETKRKD